MKLFKRLIVAVLIVVLALGGFYRFYMHPRYVVPILMYHAVDDDDSSSLYVSAENFTRQMEYLSRKGYKVISLDSLVQRIEKGEKFDHRSVVITFDDGHENNFTKAFPVLDKYKFSSTIFLITNYIGKREGYLNWDQVRLMQKSRIDFGGHTRNDIYLPSISDDPGRLWDEIAGSKEDILKATGRDALYFCYPIGGFNDVVKSTVEKAGYKGSCATNRGSDRYNTDVYELTRVKVTNSDMTKPFHFRAKLSGYYNLFRTLKSPE